MHIEKWLTLEIKIKIVDQIYNLKFKIFIIIVRSNNP
jgi:hypothetical protein